MADATVGVKQAADADRLIDNEAITSGPTSVYRQRVQIGGPGLADIAEVAASARKATSNGMATRAVPIPFDGAPQTVDVNTPVTLHAPGVGNAVRLRWVSLKLATAGDGPVVFTVKFGATSVYADELSSRCPVFVHSTMREGAANEDLTVTLDTAGQDVHVNLDLEEFTP